MAGLTLMSGITQSFDHFTWGHTKQILFEIVSFILLYFLLFSHLLFPFMFSDDVMNTHWNINLLSQHSCLTMKLALFISILLKVTFTVSILFTVLLYHHSSLKMSISRTCRKSFDISYWLILSFPPHLWFTWLPIKPVPIEYRETSESQTLFPLDQKVLCFWTSASLKYTKDFSGLCWVAIKTH